jgi:hypothetical protein
MMRCTQVVPLGKSSRCSTYCYEPLNDKGECPLHGPQWLPLPRKGQPHDEPATVSNVQGSTDTD